MLKFYKKLKSRNSHSKNTPITKTYKRTIKVVPLNKLNASKSTKRQIHSQKSTNYVTML